MAKGASMKAKPVSKCSMPRCTNSATSPRAKFCTECFKKNAKLASLKRKVWAGNKKKGKVKKNAGKRSGLRRSAKRALVVKKKWLDLILAGRKTWEIRGSSTSKRGWIHFAESQAGGKLTGRARLVNCFPVPRSSFQRHYKKHYVPSLSMVPYVTPHAWVLEDAEKFEKPFEYEHKQGAVIWVDV